MPDFVEVDAGVFGAQMGIVAEPVEGKHSAGQLTCG